jgi:hypothetical protein
VGNSPPLFYFGGTSPKPPGRGLRPLHPRLPAPVGLGFAGVLGPTHGWVARVGNSPLFWFLGAHPPDPLPGGFAPWTPHLPTLPMELAAQIAENIQKVLREEADALARQTGFVKRLRKLSGSSFAQVLITVFTENPLPSYTDLAQNAALLGVRISSQGLEQRFTKEAAQFMQEILTQLVGRVITTITPASIPILQRFNGVYIRDSTVITLPKELAEIWPGCGGSTGDTAAIKLQVRLNYTTGQLEGPALQPGRQSDRSTPYGPEGEPPGSLVLEDLGYFNLAELRERQEKGQ